MKFPTEFNRNTLVGFGFAGVIVYSIVEGLRETLGKALDKGMDVGINLNDEGIALSASHSTASSALSDNSDAPDTDIPEDTTT